MKNRSKILLALLIVLTLMVGMFTITASAATIPGGTKLYLKPNANWKVDNARFAAYFFGNGEAWVSMTDADGDGVYECESPSKNYTNVIFCRMNPSTTANNWNNKWNQTADLTYDGSKNFYTVKEGTWDKGGGTWGQYVVDDGTCAHANVTTDEKPATCTEEGYKKVYCNDCKTYTVNDAYPATGHSYSSNNRICSVCSARATFTVAGSNSGNAGSIFGTAWDTSNTANDMTYDEATDTYTKVYTNVPAGSYKFKCVQDHAWNTAYPSSDKSVTVSKAGSTLTITLKGTTVTTSVVAPVAKIGTEYFFDIPSALDAAQEGDTVTILAGTYTATLSVNKAITVVGETTSAGANRVTINGKLNVTANGATVKNLNVNNGGSTAGYINANDVLIEGCSVVGGNGFRYCYTTGVVTFKDSVITGSTYGIHFDGSAGGEIVIDGCTITGWTSFSGTINKVSMLDTSFEVGNYNYIRFYQQEVVLEGCNFNENMHIDLASSSATVTVNDCTLENGKVDYLFSDSDITNFDISVDGEELKVLYIQVNGENRYGTYADAMSTVVDGDEVTILREGTYKLLVSGKNITVTGGVDGVVFEGMGAYNMGGANVTFNNVTFNWTNANYKGLQHSGDLVYNNCTINGQVFLYGTSDIFNNCTFNQTSADAYNVWTYGSKHVEFNKCTFNSAGKSVLVYTESKTHFAEVVITETAFNASELVEGKAAIEIDTSLSAGANISVDAATTATGFDAGSVSGNSLWNNKKGNNDDKNNDIIITVGDEKVLEPLPYTVLVGTVQYTNIYAALNAAKTGDTITLYSDIILTEALAVNGKSVTLNLNGKTLTYGATTFALRATGTMITVTGNATLTIDGEGTVLTNGAVFSVEEGSDIVILGGTFDFDVTEYLADGLRVTSAVQADGTVLYGVVSNSDKAFIGGNGNWWVGDYDTGVAAQPKVENIDGYWYINGVQTGIEAGTDGYTPTIDIVDGYWVIDGIVSISASCVDGNGIVSIAKTGTHDNIDEYTITYDDGTVSVFFITNGVNGDEGDTGEDGLKGNKGPDGNRGEPGANGADNNWLVNSLLIASIVAIVLSAGVVLILNHKRLNWWN